MIKYIEKEVPPEIVAQMPDTSWYDKLTKKQKFILWVKRWLKLIMED
jgi:hypothetical protein